MTDVRLNRTADGRCTLFVGHRLAFLDLTEAQAQALARAFAGDAPPATAEPSPPARPAGRDVGARTGRMQARTPAARTSERALARLR